jgi:hypothetical protein
MVYKLATPLPLADAEKIVDGAVNGVYLLRDRLYVTSTRAMHRLLLSCVGEPTRLIAAA